MPETRDPPLPRSLPRRSPARPGGRPIDARPPGRLEAIDAVRGGAILAMIAYHAAWDLGHARLTPANLALTPAGRVAAHLIAGAFLLLVGAGLVLMNGTGLRWRSTLLRLARIGGAALLVTLATRFAFPDAYIFFGVLHCIAVSSVLALPFLFLPVPAAILGAALAAAAPLVARHPLLDAPELFFLGLGSLVPRTNDYVPLLPWFGLVLAGLAAARLGLPALARSRVGAWRAKGRLGRLATGAGRHSLAVYLVHQPALLLLALGTAALTGPHPRAGVSEFRARFEANCTRTGGDPGACRLAGRCTYEALRRAGLWAREDGDSTGEERARVRARVQALAQGCHAAAEGGVPPP